MKPVIAINCDVVAQPRRRACLNENYYDAIERAGGIPLLLPPLLDAESIDELLDRVDGVMLTGGDDIDPARYGEAPHPTVDRLDPRREQADFALLERAEVAGLPILGVCCGLQLINVHRGGSLIQDIPAQVGARLSHRGTPEVQATHEIEVEPGTLLHRLVGSRPNVNSAHHQAARTVGRGLRVIARAADGVIEGLEGTDPARFLLAVQWHPERITDWPGQIDLFRALVEAAAAEHAPEVTSIPQ